jgi:hypothetical protein
MERLVFVAFIVNVFVTVGAIFGVAKLLGH